MTDSPSRPEYARAKRSLGQNFLVDTNMARRIVASAGPFDGADAPAVLEIGPGHGALTGLLLEAGAERVMVLEKDRELARALKARLPRVGVIMGDGLTFGWEGLSGLPGLRLIGNLPYNVASPMLWEIVSRARGWSRAVFMVQYEVGRRIVARPGCGEYGALSVWLQAFSTPRLLFKVPPHVFRPQPKIDSAVLEFVPRPPEEWPASPKSLANILSLCFQKRRKQLKSILKKYFDDALASDFEARGISPQARPEELATHQFVWLGERIFSHFLLDLVEKI
ncbi:Ribosomal RNA small subunit methyltransferase A [Desulfovibrio sp. X2]|uniref:16S rRNA (adenine(1518)-N(6)/adenine(1519)-N(6))- dimethyltransferase RsmA n=1 Tax=Desulfovibrio sp. X2 TaxID=941449 RepID=UPI0003587B6B|nr:16S rRNA (adenine(1518)-N(6)/adenine(1519)-N(6))-dimethyltransferase RsmA [Desulfovibrio sp. X2]EPR42235.1 Ribosomal RNA small subunit methyltransferase A [Desulfovibrio sp. X2]